MITGAGDKARFEFSLDGFEVLRFSGSEALCAPYSFQIDLVTSGQEIPFDKLVGQPARLTIHGQNQTVRYVHGLLMRLDVIAASAQRIICSALLAPGQALLDLRRKLRVFQDLSTPEIVSQVLEEGGVSGLEWRLRDSYPPRNYCVQYRESDLDFIDRLLQEEGITTHFEHTADAVKTVFTDHNGALTAIAGDPALPYNTITSMAADPEFVSQFRFGQQLCSGKVTLRDYNFKNPRSLPEGAAPGVDPSLEVYDYPGEFVVADLGQRLATIRLEQLQQERRLASGASNSIRLQPGFRFTLGQHADRHPWDQLNREYLLVQVGHSGSQDSVLGEQGRHGTTTYANSFTVIPADTPFRPPLNAVRPKALGLHTARVVGPPGEQIYVDRYGRVKLRFHWDRERKSTSWVRVSQAWAGAGYGSLFIPRVGQEVLVSFLEGDPDRPVVVGRVHNGEQRAPSGLPQDKTFSTIKSNSSPPQSGNQTDESEGLQDDLFVNQGSNELRFDDCEGQEQVFIHAQRDYQELTKYDRTTLVKRDRVETIMHDQRVTVGQDQIVEVSEAAEHRAKHLVFQAKDKLTLKVGDSVVVLTPDCIKIGSGQILTSATQSNDLRGGLVSVNCGPERVTAEPGSAARSVRAAGAAAAGAGGQARAADLFAAVAERAVAGVAAPAAAAPQPSKAEAVADEMMSMEGKVLGNSQGGGPIANTTFSKWAVAAAEGPALPLSGQTTMSCFEAVFFAAHRAGAINWQQLHDLFSKGYSGKNYPDEQLTSEEWDAVMKWGEDLPGFMQASEVQEWQPGAQIPKGAVVMFDGVSHVALATGNGSEVMSFNAGGATAKGMVIERTTVEALTSGDQKVTYGMPPW